MSLALDFVNGAAEILKQFGKDVVLREVNSGTYDQNTQEATITTADHAVRAYIGKYDDKIVDNSTVLGSDRKVIIQAKGLTAEPQKGWQIIALDGTFDIMQIQRVELSDQSIVWICQVRRGGQ